MTRNVSPIGTAEEAWTRQSNRNAARLELLKLKRYYGLDLEFDVVRQRPGLTNFEVEGIVGQNRSRLESWTGVAFEQQREFRQRLEQIAVTGEQSVFDLVHSLRLAFRNGCSSRTVWTASDTLGDSGDF